MAKTRNLANNGKGGLLKSLQELWRVVPGRRRVQFVSLLGLTILASILEVISLGLLVPFLALIAAPLGGSTHPALTQLMDLTGIHDPAALAFFALVAFCIAAVVSGAFRLFVLYANNRFSFALATELGQQVYRRALYQPYVVHLISNSSALVDAAANKATAVAANIVGQLLGLATALFVGGGIILAITLTDPVVALVVAVIFAIIYGCVILATRAALRRNGLIVAIESARAIKALQEGTGGIRDVIIDGTQEAYVDIFRAADRPFKLALGRNAVIAGAPRFIVETVGMVLIAAMGFIFARNGSIADAIPTLGVLALGAQRLLPMLQQAYAAVAVIRGNEPLLDQVLQYLRQPLEAPEAKTSEIVFERQIELRNVCFSYPSSGTCVLSELNIVIPKGSKVGFFGPTGGGKSTTLDVIMGLLQPEHGAMLVDDVAIEAANTRGWRKHVSHVPQSIFLADSSIAENIAFGVQSSLIDNDRVRSAARLAQIDDVVASWPDRYETIVGERGVRLSGGQRQRIGIARALYKQADVLILDEATSALDNDTEAALMDSVHMLGPGITVIMVAHRLTTLRNCDFVVELQGGRISRIGAYNELIGQ